MRIAKTARLRRRFIEQPRISIVCQATDVCHCRLVRQCLEIDSTAGQAGSGTQDDVNPGSPRSGPCDPPRLPQEERAPNPGRAHIRHCASRLERRPHRRSIAKQRPRRINNSTSGRCGCNRLSSSASARKSSTAGPRFCSHDVATSHCAEVATHAGIDSAPSSSSIIFSPFRTAGGVAVDHSRHPIVRRKVLAAARGFASFPSLGEDQGFVFRVLRLIVIVLGPAIATRTRKVSSRCFNASLYNVAAMSQCPPLKVNVSD